VKIYKVTDKNGNWILVKESNRALDLYRHLEWSIEEVYVLTKKDLAYHDDEVRKGVSG
jgi:hypothetical protein